mmetsp:Transcript_17800/g.30263  ORF Transcript_17800/g.30263 Transcript_17800/m.30263 type:complete len:119 (+) Transcript_17800:245-601(+)
MSWRDTREIPPHDVQLPCGYWFGPNGDFNASKTDATNNDNSYSLHKNNKNKNKNNKNNKNSNNNNNDKSLKKQSDTWSEIDDLFSKKKQAKKQAVKEQQQQQRQREQQYVLWIYSQSD